MLPQSTRILSIEDETHAIKTFVLDAELPNAQPGQFVMLWLPGVDEKPISIAYPIPLTLAVARVGPFSVLLHRCRVGDRVGWRGPYGCGFSLREDRSALLVGGGYGTAPLHFLATHAAQRGLPTTLALGAHTAGDLLYVERFRALGVNLILATDDGSLGYRGYITDAILQSATLRLRSGQVCNLQLAIYACGPEAMLVALHRICREHGLPGQFSVERYMKCGFGICGQCALDGLLVCLDGPVFDVEQLDGLRDFGHYHRGATGRRLPFTPSSNRRIPR